MAISTSSYSNLTIPNSTISTSSKLPATTTVSFQRRTITASASISTTSKPKPHHTNLLNKLHLNPHLFSSDSSSPQTLQVYEFNEGDRRSPAFLKLSKLPEKSLGDIVTFSNKLYSGDLSTRHGITAGMIMYIEDDPEGCGDRYEAVYSFYFGKYGHVSVQGPYFSKADTELAVTGGTGVFEGAHGKVKLTNVAYPFKLFYTFELEGLKERLPKELVGGVAVDPETLKPATSAAH